MNESFKRPPTFVFLLRLLLSSSLRFFHLPTIFSSKTPFFLPIPSPSHSLPNKVGGFSFHSIHNIYIYTSMASAMAISESAGDSSKGRERRRKMEAEPRWKTEIQERLYSSKLFEAIRLAGGRRPSPPPKPSSLSPAPSRIVREAADRALAVAARGRSRWSRAILSRRQWMRVRKVTRKAAAGIRRRRPPAAGVVDSEVGLEKRVRALGRLVPGGRKLPLSTLLEETTDYIPALEMQVRTMTALWELLSSSAAASTAAALGNVAPC